MTMLSGDGKLITLQRVNLKSQLKVLDPFRYFPFYFHIAPSAISYAKSPSYSDQQVVRRGTVSQFGGPGLMSISWDGEFAEENYYAVDGGGTYIIPPPAGFTMYHARRSIDILRSITDNGYVVNLSIQDRVTGVLDVVMPVTIRDFTVSENGGEPDSRFYSISFTEYRPIKLRTVPRGGTPSTDPPMRPTTEYGRFVDSPYIVPRQLGIKKVSLYAYHDQSRYKDIIKANGGRKGMKAKGCTYNPKATNGPWICPKGTRLTIPRLNIKQSR